MTKYIKINKARRLVKDAVNRVLAKRKDMLLEMRNRHPRRDYLDLSKTHPDRTHKPIYIHREWFPGEFEVFFENSMYLKEGREEQYPPTLDTKYVIEYIKQQISESPKELEFYLAFRNKKDHIARALTVSLEDDVEFRLYEEPLILLDELFHECGYFRSTPDKVFLKEGVKHHGVRVIQYEPYHYEYHKRLVVPKTIYHVTTREHKDDILEQGFIASSKPDVDWLTYPPRNYFFTKLDENLMVGYMHISQKISDEEDVNEVTIFHITTERLKHIKFYSDPLFNEKEAIYTYDDIPNAEIEKAVNVMF